MNRKMTFLGITMLIILCCGFQNGVDAKMFKEVAIGVFDNAPSMADCDRYYMRYHGPEVTRAAGPWMTRYQLWLPYDPPKEAVERFGAVRGRYAELWFREDDYVERPPLKGATMAPWFKNSVVESMQTVVMVPAIPTEEFYDSDPHPEETSILRWVTIFKYPEGVSVEEGEKWFLETHAKETLKQPGLLKFVSHRVATLKNSALSFMTDLESSDADMSPGISGVQSYVRMCEYWYSDFESWHRAVMEMPPEYTAPSWGGEYPYVDMVSTFIPYYNDVDFLKGTYRVNFDRPNVNYTTSP